MKKVAIGITKQNKGMHVSDAYICCFHMHAMWYIVIVLGSTMVLGIPTLWHIDNYEVSIPTSHVIRRCSYIIK